ncbi:hypothetical protein ACFL5V_01500 [Fibrobacterota bacterium]
MDVNHSSLHLFIRWTLSALFSVVILNCKIEKKKETLALEGRFQFKDTVLVYNDTSIYTIAITFNKDSTYLLEEFLQDDLSNEEKGKYILDEDMISFIQVRRNDKIRELLSGTVSPWKSHLNYALRIKTGKKFIEMKDLKDTVWARFTRLDSMANVLDNMRVLE